MTIDATVERTDVVGVVTGVVDELVARVAAISDAQSGPGPPEVVIIAGQRVELGPESVLVGRSTSMFGIDHPKVSRRHVGVQLVDGVLIASDLESRNGTWLVRGGERCPLTPMAVLWPGDRLVTLNPASTSFRYVCADVVLVIVWFGRDRGVQPGSGLETPAPAQLASAGPAAPAPPGSVAVGTVGVTRARVPDSGIPMSIAAQRVCWLALTVDDQPIAYRMLQRGEKVSVHMRRHATLRTGDAGALLVSIGNGPARALGPPGPAVRTIAAHARGRPAGIRAVAPLVVSAFRRKFRCKDDELPADPPSAQTEGCGASARFRNSASREGPEATSRVAERHA